MTVEHYAVEGRTAPLVLGVLEGDGRRARRPLRRPLRHGARACRSTGRATLDGRTSRTACSTAAARWTARARAGGDARRASRQSSPPATASQRPDLLHVGLRRRGRLPRRRADGRPRRARARRHGLLGRGDEQPRRSRSPTPASRPGRSRRSGAPPTRPSPRRASTRSRRWRSWCGGRRGPAGAAEGRLEVVRAARDHNAIRTLPGGGWAIPGRCDAVLSSSRPPGTTLTEVRDADRRLPARAGAGGRRGALRAEAAADGRRPTLAAPRRGRTLSTRA